MLSLMSGFRPDPPATPERTDSQRKVDSVRALGGIFVQAVGATRVPMLVADATLPGTPVIFANGAFLAMSGYTMDEILGQEPHFLDGPETDPATIQRFKAAITEGRDERRCCVNPATDRLHALSAALRRPFRRPACRGWSCG